MFIPQIDDLISEEYRHAKVAKEGIVLEVETKPPKHKGGGRNRKGSKSEAASSMDNTMDHVLNCIKHLQKEILLIPEKCAEVTINVYFMGVYFTCSCTECVAFVLAESHREAKQERSDIQAI